MLSNLNKVILEDKNILLIKIQLILQFDFDASKIYQYTTVYYILQHNVPYTLQQVKNKNNTL